MDSVSRAVFIVTGYVVESYKKVTRKTSLAGKFGFEVIDGDAGVRMTGDGLVSLEAGLGQYLTGLWKLDTGVKCVEAGKNMGGEVLPTFGQVLRRVGIRPRKPDLELPKVGNVLNRHFFLHPKHLFGSELRCFRLSGPAGRS